VPGTKYLREEGKEGRKEGGRRKGGREERRGGEKERRKEKGRKKGGGERGREEEEKEGGKGRAVHVLRQPWPPGTPSSPGKEPQMSPCVSLI
jgi:hypothetical protein